MHRSNFNFYVKKTCYLTKNTSFIIQYRKIVKNMLKLIWLIVMNSCSTLVRVKNLETEQHE